METISPFSFEACCAPMVGDMAKVLSERNGETPGQQLARAQSAIRMIMGFLPRDVIETMLASHCVMFHELMVDCLHDGFRTEERTARRAELNGLIPLNKAFCGTLDHLKRSQKRPADRSREDAPGTPVAVQPAPRPVADVVRQQRAAEPAGTSQAPAPAALDPMSARQPSPVDPAPVAPVPTIYRPTAEAIDRCHGKPAARGAFHAGDPVGLAQAMGIEQPSEASLAAANTPGSPFDPGSSAPSPETASPANPK
jgi:hypothetical protein